MALLTSELARIKHELGFALLTTANPYIDVAAIFESVVQPYLQAGDATTSSTVVTAATTPTPVTLTLASATGFASNARVVIDVDDRQEIVTVQNLSGTSMTVLLSKAHTGTYPVTVEGGETIVREILTRIREVKTELGKTFGTGALQRVDEIWFYNTSGVSVFGNLGKQLQHWRDELASALGVASLWARKRAGAQRLANY